MTYEDDGPSAPRAGPPVVDETIFGPLERWNVTLTGSVPIQIWAHGFRIEDGDHVFVALIRGKPPYEREVSRVPSRFVEDITD